MKHPAINVLETLEKYRKPSNRESRMKRAAITILKALALAAIVITFAYALAMARRQVC